MRKTVVAAVLSLWTAWAAAGCSDKSTPVAPEPLSVTGTWAGAVTISGTATRMTWSLTQSATAAVTGPVLVALPSGTVLLNGFLTGTLSGTTLTYAISVGPGGVPTQPACTGQVTGTMAVSPGMP